jgi:hypothetical protein
MPTRASPKAAGEQTGPFSLDKLALGPFAPEDQNRLRLPLAAYAQIFSLSGRTELLRCDGQESCGGSRLRSGPLRIDAASIRHGSTLRLMLRSAEGSPVANGWVLRAYQAAPSDPSNLLAAGEGVQLPALGPVFQDIELVHSLMPMILELSDGEGVTRDIALLPFPSLLPGGIHGAELTALQNEANPMDAFWSLSGILLEELLGRPDWPQRSIKNLSVRSDGVLSSESAVSPDLQEWLGAVFGLALDVTTGTSPDTHISTDGLGLILPTNAVPTISALVSRRLSLGEAVQMAGPYLVANADSLQARWSVGIPPDTQQTAGIPILVRLGPDTAVERARNVSIHLSIALRSAEGDENGFLLKTGSRIDKVSSAPAEALRLSVLLEASNGVRSEAVIRDLVAASGSSEIEFFVRTDGADQDLRDAIERSCGNNKWVSVPCDLDLRELARDARHDLLVTISDRVSLHDRNVLRDLCRIVDDQPAIGSASLVLLKETIVKDRAVWQTATGGLFPAGISFATSPRLGFFEPDVLEALPDLTYPVVANTLLLTVWNRHALAELPRLSGPVPLAARDIRLGLDLLERGYRNLCTTRGSAGLFGPHVRGDTIDPFGSAYVEPGRWEDILSRVTVLRELF